MKSTKKGRCVAWFKEFDASTIKPLLLHNYDKEAHKLRKEFYDQLFKDGEKLEEKFVENQANLERSRLSQIGVGRPYLTPRNIQLTNEDQKLDSENSAIEMKNRGLRSSNALG